MMLWKLPQLFTPITKRHIEQQVLYNTNIHKLFRIIQDVDQYSNFLPLCTYSKIIPSSQRILDEDGRNYFEATLTVGVPPFLQETYDSAVYINQEEYTIETHSIKSQKFDSLKSYWKLSSASSPNTATTLSLDDITTTTLRENIHPNIPNNRYTQSIHPLLKKTLPLSPSPSSASTTTTTIDSTTTTHVYFMVEMTVSDPLIATTLDQLLVKVAQQQVEAFAQRCQTM